MKLNQTAYLVKGNTVKRVVVVAKHWIFEPWPAAEYIVAPVGNEKNIVHILNTAFFGSEPLEVCRSHNLVAYTPDKEAAK